MKKSREEQNQENLELKQTVGLLSLLFRYSDTKDALLMTLGTIGCVADGSSTPLIMLVLSRIMNKYSAHSDLTLHNVNEVGFTYWIDIDKPNILRILEAQRGIPWTNRGRICFSVLSNSGGRWCISRTMLGSNFREADFSPAQKIFKSCVKTRCWVPGYKARWFNNISSYFSISTGTLTIQSVLSEKVPNFLMNIAAFVSSQIVSLYLSWRLSVITIPALLLLIVPGIVYGKLLAELGMRIQEAYGIAGGIAEQAFPYIRILHSYVAEHHTQKGFSAALERSLELGIKQGFMKGLAIGSVGVAFAVWAFQAWYGSILVTEQGARGGDVFTAGVCIVVGGLLWRMRYTAIRRAKAKDKSC